MASLNTAAMQVPRIEFCKLVPDAAVTAPWAASRTPTRRTATATRWTSPDVGNEVVHEIGCSWSTDDGATARAWVFARPVDAAFARTVIASSRKTKGCRVARGPSYGEPSVTQTCRQPDGSTRVRHAGLFGQTWLTCEVADPTDRRGRRPRPGRPVVRRGGERAEHRPLTQPP